MKRQLILDDLLDIFEKAAIGFNSIVPSAVHGANVTYPPFNVVKEAQGSTVIEMALAGFSKEDVTISKSNNFLTIEGNKAEDTREFYWHGIAARKFKREIPIANNVEVISAEMKDGILKVFLENKEIAAKQIPVL